MLESTIQENDSTPPIILHINSFGGSLFHGLSGLDKILKCKVEVRTIVDGCCASAATFYQYLEKTIYK